MSEEPGWDMNLDIKSSSRIDLCERGENVNLGGEYEQYESTSLIDVDECDVDINVSYGSGDETIDLGLSAYHQENTETKRVFHAHLTAHLTMDQARMLRDSLNHLFKLGREMKWD
jgi:hypothetical protein